VSDPERYDSPQRALRLTFEYAGSEVRLVSRQRVAMLVPPPDPAGAEEEQAGFWYEVQDAQGRPIYRRRAPNPVRTDVEVFSPDPNEPFTHVEMPEPRGVFTLLVPDLEGARTLALVGGPPGPEQGVRAAQEIARFDLTEELPAEESE
jgi:hypothetical protein